VIRVSSPSFLGNDIHLNTIESDAVRERPSVANDVTHNLGNYIGLYSSKILGALFCLMLSLSSQMLLYQ